MKLKDMPMVILKTIVGFLVMMLVVAFFSGIFWAIEAIGVKILFVWCLGAIFIWGCYNVGSVFFKDKKE